jgi:hypothetical protein
VLPILTVTSDPCTFNLVSSACVSGHEAHLEARGYVDDSDRRLGGVDVLPSSPAGPHSLLQGLGFRVENF